MQAEMTVSIFIFICSQLARMGVNSDQGLDPVQELLGEGEPGSRCMGLLVVAFHLLLLSWFIAVLSCQSGIRAS